MAILKQGLHKHRERKDKRQILSTINDIGILQLDTINVVERSHYLVMFSRLGNYDQRAMDSLLYPDKKVFEQWAHAVSILPISDYPYIMSVSNMPNERLSRYLAWFYKNVKNPDALLKRVEMRIRKEGPLASRHFEDPNHKSRAWWDWKPSKDAIQILYLGGTLMVEKRVGFQRYYNLTERVLPKQISKIKKTQTETKEWFVLKALSCMGIGTARQVADYYRRSNGETKEIIERLLASGKITKINVNGWKTPAFIRKKDLQMLDEVEKGKHEARLTTFLSPFDNLIWDRDRTRLLFDFHYRISVYDSVKKGNRPGYYVMPILHKGQLVGRIDPKADRKNKTLIIHSIHLEPGVKATKALARGIGTALHEFMLFNKCERLVIEKSNNNGLLKQLNQN